MTLRILNGHCGLRYIAPAFWAFGANQKTVSAKCSPWILILGGVRLMRIFDPNFMEHSVYPHYAVRHCTARHTAHWTTGSHHNYFVACARRQDGVRSMGVAFAWLWRQSIVSYRLDVEDVARSLYCVHIFVTHFSRMQILINSGTHTLLFQRRIFVDLTF